MAGTGPIHAFLRGAGRDGRGRRLADVLAFDDARIEAVHDFIQWLFFHAGIMARNAALG